MATSEPPRVDFCGRHSYPGGDLHSLTWVREEAASTEREDSSVRAWTGLRRVSVAPGGTAVLADVPRSECTTPVVYVNVSGDSYEPYNGDAGG